MSYDAIPSSGIFLNSCFSLITYNSVLVIGLRLSKQLRNDFVLVFSSFDTEPMLDSIT